LVYNRNVIQTRCISFHHSEMRRRRKKRGDSMLAHESQCPSSSTAAKRPERNSRDKYPTWMS